MRTLLKGVVLLFVFIMALSVMPVSNAQALDTELFVYKSPDFTVNVPKDWHKASTHSNPAIVLEKRSKKNDIDTFIIAVMDLPEGETLKGGVERFIGYLQKVWNATNCQTLYEREIKLKDDTLAYEYEIKWDNPSIRDNSYTYRVVAFKDKKTITVGVTSDKQVSDELKQLPLSLTFTIANASLPQGMKKTITLPSGEVVCDLNGEWDSSAENYGEWSQYGTWPGVAKIIQQGSSFVVIKMKGSSMFPVGSEIVRGEFDKSGFKKVKVMTGMGPLDVNGQISDDGNKIVFDEGKKVRVTYTRK